MIDAAMFDQAEKLSPSQWNVYFPLPGYVDLDNTIDLLSGKTWVRALLMIEIRNIVEQFKTVSLETYWWVALAWV